MKLNQFMAQYLIYSRSRDELFKITKTEMVAYLLAAMAKISTPATWTQGTNARDANDEKVLTSNPGAVKFCSLGAIMRNEYDERDQYVDMVFRKAAAIVKSETGFTITAYNDNHSHSEVMQLWDDVISVVNALEE